MSFRPRARAVPPARAAPGADRISRMLGSELAARLDAGLTVGPAVRRPLSTTALVGAYENRPLKTEQKEEQAGKEEGGGEEEQEGRVREKLETMTLLGSLSDEVLQEIVIALVREVDSCTALDAICRTNSTFRAICNREDQGFWKELCSLFGYDRTDRTTDFHAMDENAHMAWKMQFEKWCGLRFMRKYQLKDQVDALLELDTTGAASLPPYGPIGTWDVSRVTDMGYMFSNARAFNQDIEKWDVSRVTNMATMFYNAHIFNKPLEKWDVSRVTNMSGMFFGAMAFNQPLNGWGKKVSTVKDMSRMFAYTENFDKPLGDWDVSSVIYMLGMFYEAKLFKQSLEGWREKVSNVEHVTDMFVGVSAATPIPSWYSEKL